MKHRRVIKASKNNVSFSGNLYDDTATLEHLGDIVNDIEYMVNYDNFNGDTIQEYVDLFQSLKDRLSQMADILGESMI